MSVEIGLSDNQRKEIAAGVSKVLADTFVLYTKTHGYHWNVTGPRFRSLHLMFEEQYTELFNALDDLAERIRALGVFAPAGAKQFADLASLEDDTSVPDAEAMIGNLTADHETMSRSLRAVITQAEEAGDQGTADLLTARLQEHEKAAWMLRSLRG